MTLDTTYNSCPENNLPNIPKTAFDRKPFYVDGLARERVQVPFHKIMDLALENFVRIKCALFHWSSDANDYYEAFSFPFIFEPHAFGQMNMCSIDRELYFKVFMWLPSSFCVQCSRNR